MSTTFTLLFHYCTLTFNHFIANLLSYPVHHPAFIVSHMYLHSPPPLPSDPHPSSLLFSLCIPDPSVLTLYSLAVISLSPPSLSWHAASDSGRGGGSVSWWQQRKQGKVPADYGSDDGVSLGVVVLFPNPPQVLSRCFFFFACILCFSAVLLYIHKLFSVTPGSCCTASTSVCLLNWTQVGLKAVEVLEEGKWAFSLIVLLFLTTPILYSPWWTYQLEKHDLSLLAF